MDHCPLCDSTELESRTVIVREPSGEVFTETFEECLRCGAELLPEETIQQTE